MHFLYCAVQHRRSDAEEIMTIVREKFKSKEEMANLALVEKMVVEVEKKMAEMQKISEIISRTDPSKSLNQVQIKSISNYQQNVI